MENEVAFGRDRGGATSLVILTVKRAYIVKEMYRGKGELDIAALRLIGRSGIDQYLVADGQFTIARPNTDETFI